GPLRSRGEKDDVREGAGRVASRMLRVDVQPHAYRLRGGGLLSEQAAIVRDQVSFLGQPTSRLRRPGAEHENLHSREGRYALRVALSLGGRGAVPDVAYHSGSREGDIELGGLVVLGSRSEIASRGKQVGSPLPGEPGICAQVHGEIALKAERGFCASHFEGGEGWTALDAELGDPRVPHETPAGRRPPGIQPPREIADRQRRGSLSGGARGGCAEPDGRGEEKRNAEREQFASPRP